MKDYIKPELDYVVFASEQITDDISMIPGEGGGNLGP